MIWCPESGISTVLFSRRLFVGMKRSIKTKPVKPVLFLWVKSEPNYSPAFLSLRVNSRNKAVKIWNGRLSGINDMVLFLYPLYQTWFCLALVIEDLACGHQSNDEWLNGVVWFHPWIGPKCFVFILVNYCAKLYTTYIPEVYCFRKELYDSDSLHAFPLTHNQYDDCWPDVFGCLVVERSGPVAHNTKSGTCIIICDRHMPPVCLYYRIACV